MTAADLDRCLAVAQDAARRAATICRRVQDDLVPQGLAAKTGDEPVTIADYASQAVIHRQILRAFPDHSLLSEESSEHLRGASSDALRGRVVDLVSGALDAKAGFDELCGWIDHRGDATHRFRWTVDPIDGTKGFLRREQYAVAIGLLEDGVPVLGVLACPSLPESGIGADRVGVLMWAVKGRGARQESLAGGGARAIHASTRSSPKDIRVLGSVESSHGDPKLVTDLVAALRLDGGVVKVDSQVKYGVLARGDAEVYLRPRSTPTYRDNVWDHAAGAAIAAEAGGRVGDLRGAALDFRLGKKLEKNDGVLVTNGPMHDAIVTALAKLRGPAS